MQNNEQTDLFEVLKEKLQCNYISDMRFSPYNKMARAEFLKIDRTLYSEKMVRDLEEYLFE